MTTDVYHITIAGENPHDVAAQMQEQDSPFYDEIMHASVAQHIIAGDDEIVGGIVEVWAPEHLTAKQERYLEENPHVIDTRHVWPD